jgi:hypothetical protein
MIAYFFPWFRPLCWARPQLLPCFVLLLPRFALPSATRQIPFGVYGIYVLCFFSVAFEYCSSMMTTFAFRCVITNTKIPSPHVLRNPPLFHQTFQTPTRLPRSPRSRPHMTSSLHPAPAAQPPSLPHTPRLSNTSSHSTEHVAGVPSTFAIPRRRDRPTAYTATSG